MTSPLASCMQEMPFLLTANDVNEVCRAHLKMRAAAGKDDSQGLLTATAWTVCADCCGKHAHRPSTVPIYYVVLSPLGFVPIV